MALAHDPSGPLPPCPEDQQPPAAIVPADLRAGQVDGAVALCGWPVEPEEWTGLRAFGEDTLVLEEFDLVRVDDDRCPFPGVYISDLKPVPSAVLFDGMDQAQMTAAFPALVAFERQMIPLVPGFACILLKAR